MTYFDEIAKHYTRGDLLQAISIGVEKLGKTSETVAIEDLAPVDEFHIGGSLATRSFFDQVAFAAEDLVLDIGCGIGGASRFAAQTYGCRVTVATNIFSDLSRELRQRLKSRHRSLVSTPRLSVPCRPRNKRPPLLMLIGIRHRLPSSLRQLN